MSFRKRLVSCMLVMVLFVTMFANTGLAETLSTGGAARAPSAAGLLLSSGDTLTWAQAAKQLCGLLGYIIDDGAEIDFAALANRIPNLDPSDDSLYLAILAHNGSLFAGDIPDAHAPISPDAYERMINGAFSAAVLTQAEADTLATLDDGQNVIIAGDALNISAIRAKRVAVGRSERLALSGMAADVVSIVEPASVYIARSELGGVRVGTENDEDVYLHMDDKTEIPVVAIESAGDVVLEGSGALGMVRVLGDIGSLTVRATGSVTNETRAPIQVTGPDGESVSLAPDAQIDFVLTKYLVSFISDGESVETQQIAPGGMVNFRAALTQLAGKRFTAWYEDANYARPYSMLSTVDEQLTLYARFVDDADALTVTFETFGGNAVEPLVFAKGEYLLCKPAEKLYTSKEGFTFSGWCVDEACTQPFGYTQPITESMTLYAMFISNDPQEVEEGNRVAELHDLDWKSAIKLTVPDGMTLDAVRANVLISEGTGELEPELKFRKTSAGYEAYGEYYSANGVYGFEPGATFNVTASGGVKFSDFADDIETLVVSVYREQVEIVEFAEGLKYVLWDNVSAFVPVNDTDTSYSVTYTEDGEVDETEVEGTAVPGTLFLGAGITVKPDEIVVFYDGEISANEKSITAWEGGDLNGHVLFAQIMSAREQAGGTQVEFTYANPVDYLAALDVHITGEVDLEEQLDEDEMARIERSILEQVASNEELAAQMLVSVMTSAETQSSIDSIHGEGVYSLAALSPSIKVNAPEIKVTTKDSKATVRITISATVTLREGGTVIISMTPKLTFEQEVTVKTSVDGGSLWIDASLTITSKSTIRLEVTASTGDMSSVLSEAKSTLEKLITPEGLDNSIDYVDSVNQLMNTMNSLISTDLAYQDLFVVPLLKIVLNFYGIITLSLSLDLVGQIGLLASFGIELVVTNGQRIGFKYNFTKFKGGTSKKDLESDVRNSIYLVGKVGVRLGLRLTLSITLCAIVTVSISGNLYAYAELTGIFYYTASLLSGDSTYIGAMKFEVGIDASIVLSLKVNLVIKTIKKSWTVWKQRWKLWSMSRSSTLSLMDIDALSRMWDASTSNARGKTVFGFDYVPMKTYTLMNAKMVENQMLWDSTQGKDFLLTLTMENLLIDGKSLPESDPRCAVVKLGDGTNGRSRGKLYVDESVAAEYKIEHIACDIVLDYENNASSALVKKQTHRFRFERPMILTTTTVNVKIALYDWCAHAWGIEQADWDDNTIYETRIENTHVLGALVEPTATYTIKLDDVLASARNKYPELNDIALSWYNPVRSGLASTLEYSMPRISNFCYMTPDNGIIRYDVHPETYETTLTWYLYASRFPGLSGNVRYTLRVPQGGANYAFNVRGSADAEPMVFKRDPSAEGVWTLEANRAAFDGTPRPLMMSIGGANEVASGLTITGREPGDAVELTLKDIAFPLTISPTYGVEGYTLVYPENIQAGVKPGTEIQLNVKLKSGFRNVKLDSTPKGLEYVLDGNIITFTMPSHEVSVKLSAYRVRAVDYDYNYKQLGVYKRVFVAENEKVKAPVAPAVDGLTFRNWYLTPECDGDMYVFGERPTEAFTLYADWTCDVTIDFIDAKGQAVYLNNGYPELVFAGDESEYYRFTYSTQRVGETPLDILLPNYSGYDFMGWYLSADYAGEPIDIDTYTLEGGITLYARWVLFVTVDYDLNFEGADAYHSALEHQGLALNDVPADPVRDYYTFNGWYVSPLCREQDAFNPATDVTNEDVTLYAGWTADPFTIEYDLSGGENDARNVLTYTVDSPEIIIYAPSRAGYDFMGWTGTELTQPTLDVRIPTGSHVNREYAATWSPINYDIKYDLLRGEVSPPNPTSYTIEDEAITLNNPAQDKYTFTGWTGTDLDEPTMTVVIPKGSLGDREYNATWTTDDPASQIADYALNAIYTVYTYDIDDYVNGTDATSSICISALNDIETNIYSAPYAEDITLLIETAGERTESDYDYMYPFTATITYTDDQGEALTRSKSISAKVLKRAPVIADTLSASDITYGQTLASSTLQGALATYGGAEVTGTFAWDDSTIVPLGANNGEEIYKVVFTPDDPSVYAYSDMNIAVRTQTGVYVTITAQSRDYIKNSTQATVEYTLSDNDTDDALTSLSLTGGSAAFPQANPGDDLKVTYTGYSLVTPTGEENDYVLINEVAEGKASILWIVPTLTPPTAVISYGDVLRNVPLTGGTAVHNSASVSGTWAWATPAYTVSDITQTEFSVVFTPTDTIGVKGGTVSLSTTVNRAPVAVPQIASKTYNGNTQTADVPSSTRYSIESNAGGKNAGDYQVKLRLTDATNYRWADDATGTNPVKTLTFKILPAQLTVSGTPTVKKLGYGQKLTSGSDVGDKELSAATMISGVSVKHNNTSVAGRWVWDLTGITQPLNASSEGYGVNAFFEITSSDKANYIQPRLNLKVFVERAVPDLTNSVLTCSPIYLSNPASNTLASSTITDSGRAVNPVTGETISGSWSWEDGNRVPDNNNKVWNAVFMPSASGNYTTNMKPATVTFRNWIYVYVYGESHPDGKGGCLIYNNARCTNYTLSNVTPGTTITIRPYTGIVTYDMGGQVPTRFAVDPNFVTLDGWLGSVNRRVSIHNTVQSDFSYYYSTNPACISVSDVDGDIRIVFDKPNYPVTGDLTFRVYMVTRTTPLTD